jgi:hypothetical protein
MTHTIDIGNFSNGMQPDVIGAADSMVDIVDGWVPRVGEIRKRGGKSLYEAYGTARRAGAKSTELGSGSLGQVGYDPDNGYGFAFTGGGTWTVKRFPDGSVTDLSSTISLQLFPPFAALTSISLGGGDQVKNFGNILASVGPGGDGAIRRLGFWGGAIANNASTALGVTLTNGSREATGTFTPANFLPGAFLTIDKAAGTAPNPDAVFMIISATTDRVVLDRPWPGTTDTDYQLLGRTALAEVTDPHDVGANGARVLETHQDRLFLANFDPGWVQDGNDVTERERNPSRVRWSAAYAENGDGTIDTDLAVYGEHLYYENGFVDVFPGQGGAITGMHSLGNSLVIVKEDSVYALRGSVSSKGFPSGATVDVVNLESGSNSYRGSAKTEIGVVWANNRGLWVYDGNQVLNLVDTVIDTAWNKVITDFSDVVVSGANERIIVQQPSNNIAWVYHIDKQYFTRQSCHPHTAILPFGDSVFGNIELGIDDVTGNIVDWSSDLTEAITSDSENAAFPRLSLQTQPLPADNHPFFTARPHRLFVAGHFTETMDASILLGRSEFDEDFELEDQVDPDDTKPLEYGVEVFDYDHVNEIRIGGVSSRAAHRFQLTQTDPAERMRVYGIGVEYLEDYTVGIDSDG